MKKISFILAMIVLLTVSGCSKSKVDVVDINSSQSKGISSSYVLPSDDYDTTNETTTDKTAKSEVIHQDKTLSYKHTQTLGDNVFDVYTDDSGAEYNFNKSGTLFGYSNIENASIKGAKLFAKTPEKAVTQEQAQQIALEFLENTLGFSSDDYEMTYISEVGESISVDYSKKVGKDKFITLDTYYCHVAATGDILYCGVKNPELVEGFLEASVSDISKQDLIESAEKVLSEQYGDSLVSFELTDAYIYKNKEQFEIRGICDAAIAEAEHAVSAEIVFSIK